MIVSIIIVGICALIGLFMISVGVRLVFPNILIDHPQYIDKTISKNYIHKNGDIVYKTYSEAEKTVLSIISLGLILGDKNSGIYDQKIDTDQESFWVLSDIYARNSKTVFYTWKPLLDSDPNTFHILPYKYSYDKNHIWYAEKSIIPDVTISTSTDVQVFNKFIFAIGEQSYFYDMHNNNVFELSEMPVTEIGAYCSYWYTMNGSFWYQDIKVDVPSDVHTVVSCDNATLLTYSSNFIYLLDKQGIQKQTELSDDVQEVWVSNFLNSTVVVVQLTTDELYAYDFSSKRPLQFLGRREGKEIVPAEGFSTPLKIGNVIWKWNSQQDDSEHIFTEVDSIVKTEGDFIFTEDAVYSGDKKIMGANPNTFKVFSGRYSNTFYGKDNRFYYMSQYISDVPSENIIKQYGATPYLTEDSDASLQEYEKQIVDDIYNKKYVFYDNLKYEFVPDMRIVKEPRVNDGYYEYLLGSVQITNVTTQQQVLSHSIYDSLTIWNERETPLQEITFDKIFDLKPTADGYNIPPGDKILWPVYVNSKDRDVTVALILQIKHSVEKKNLFRADTFILARSYISSDMIDTY